MVFRFFFFLKAREGFFFHFGLMASLAEWPWSCGCLSALRHKLYSRSVFFQGAVVVRFEYSKWANPLGPGRLGLTRTLLLCLGYAMLLNMCPRSGSCQESWRRVYGGAELCCAD